MYQWIYILFNRGIVPNVIRLDSIAWWITFHLNLYYLSLSSVCIFDIFFENYWKYLERIYELVTDKKFFNVSNYIPTKANVYKFLSLRFHFFLLQIVLSRLYVDSIKQTKYWSFYGLDPEKKRYFTHKIKLILKLSIKLCSNENFSRQQK